MEATVVVALVTGVVGIVTAYLTLRATRITEAAKTAQVTNATEIDAMRVKLEGWADLTDGLREDNERLTTALVAERANNDALRAQLRACLENR